LGNYPVRPIEEQEKQYLLQNSHLTSKRIIQDLRESIWALKKNEIPFVAFCDKLKSSIQHLNSPQQTLIIRFEEHIDASMLGPEEALNLLRICQEATHNSIRHSKGSNLKITLKSDAGHYEIILEDDGIGFSKQKKVAQCFGLENMKHRAAEIGAKLLIESAINNGTKVSISK
jgi:signal transduction histidine kinase